MLNLAQRLVDASKGILGRPDDNPVCGPDESSRKAQQLFDLHYLEHLVYRALHNASAAGRCINPRWTATIAVCIPLVRYLIEDESIDSHGPAQHAKWLPKGVGILNRLLQRRGVGIHVNEADLSILGARAGRIALGLEGLHAHNDPPCQ